MMFILMLFLISFSPLASASFTLDQVNVDCPESLACSQRTTTLKNLIGKYRSLVHLKDTLRIMASAGGYQNFSYELHDENKTNVLKVKFNLKPRISEISIGFLDRNLEHDPLQLLSIREGDFFETQKLKQSMDGLKSKLEAMGYPNNSHSFEVVENDQTVNINIIITLGKPRIFKNVKSNSTSTYIQQYLKNKFNYLYNKPFDLNKFKIYIDEAQKELFSYGYYLLNLDFVPVIKGNRVNLDIKVSNDQLFAFDFKNLEEEDRDTLHDLVIDLFRKYKRPLTNSTIINALNEHYKSKALLNAEVRIETSEFTNMYNEVVHLYRLYLDENTKTRLNQVSFSGNKFYGNTELKRMFNKEAFELASLRYFDREYFSYFQEFLKNQYIQKGFVHARVLDPKIEMDAEKKNSTLEYRIQEGVRTYIRKIDFEGLPLELESKILNELDNKVGGPFNPLSMVDDIKRVAEILQESGFYYAEVLNLNDSEFVRYSKNGSDVFIKFKIDTGPIVKLNRVLYLGNNKTKKKVIRKKVFIKPGELITPSKTREIESNLSATGLFNSVSVTPLKHNSQNAATDLIVRVVEREYGLIEIAPGYRTDLGLKLTGTITYQNLGGYNRSVTLKSTVNQRLSFRTLEPERRRDAKHILEHNNTLSFSQGDVFDSLIDVGASIAFQTRRFYAFDANIYRTNATLSRDLTDNLSASLRYQYEDIKQYNATNEINNGSFEIGAITPSLSLDLRNSQVNPLKGAFFNVSTEFANPFLLSQEEPDLTINYYKFISRNYFYFPYSRGTIAMSLVGGIQENLAKDKITVNGVEQTEGYIPNIKVFRLTGMDIVRGFNDEEINRLPDNRDIADLRIDNKAYLVNFKLEPRYFINDTLITGIFYDAGRVFVDQVDFGELRDSVGVTFKILTPVGTLDFNYGIKLLRKRDADGSLESPGRFHVSIGFF